MMAFNVVVTVVLIGKQEEDPRPPANSGKVVL